MLWGRCSACRECLHQAVAYGILCLAGVERAEAVRLVEEHLAAKVGSFTDRHGLMHSIHKAVAARAWEGRYWVDLRRFAAENATTFL